MYIVVSEAPADSWTPELVTTDPQEEGELTAGEEGEPTIDVASLQALLSHPNLRQVNCNVVLVRFTKSLMLNLRFHGERART